VGVLVIDFSYATNAPMRSTLSPTPTAKRRQH